MKLTLKTCFGLFILLTLLYVGTDFSQAQWTATGKADQTMGDRTHVTVSIDVSGEAKPLVYDRWVDTSDWSKDAKLVIAQMAKFKLESVAKEAANQPATVADTPKEVTKDEGERSIAADEKAKAEAKKASEDAAKASEVTPNE